MNLKDILLPKSFQLIRKEIPCRYTTASIDDDYFDLNTGEKYFKIEYDSLRMPIKKCYELIDRIISAFQNDDQIILNYEIFYGEYHFEDYLKLTELFTNNKKWDLTFCQSIFEGDGLTGSIEVINKTKKEAYVLVESRDFIRKFFLKHVENLELIKLHLKFEALGGMHETTSRFTGLVQRAGWTNGVKMISAIIESFESLQSNKILINDSLITRISDRIRTDYNEIVYQFSTVSDEIDLVVKHNLMEDVTTFKVFKNDSQIHNTIIYEWFIPD